MWKYTISEYRLYEGKSMSWHLGSVIVWIVNVSHQVGFRSFFPSCGITCKAIKSLERGTALQR